MIHNVDHQTSLQPSRWPHNSDQQLGAKEIQLTKGGESSPQHVVSQSCVQSILFRFGMTGRGGRNLFLDVVVAQMAVAD